ncbi:MAG: RNase adapter RapZ [Bacillota bacterium]|nr:RNase adapter RapZ [Bacillota bacterium]
MRDLRFVIVTGLSGAGKSEAIRALEDLGYFCVDNLPPSLLPKFAELCSQGGPQRAAAVIDVRGGEFFDDVYGALEELERASITYTILYLEATDEALVRRFKATRRLHPLAPQGGVLDGIRAERQALDGLRGRARTIIDTSDMAPRVLRDQLAGVFGDRGGRRPLAVTVTSFGFKHGLPLDADLVFDVRFLPNPNYVASLSDLDGNHPQVAAYVLRWPIVRQFMRRLRGMVSWLLPHYLAEGKSQLQICLGCTGGRHRSVVIANRLAQALREANFSVTVHHRDLSKGGSTP